jgi:hypothetical protein
VKLDAPATIPPPGSDGGGSAPPATAGASEAPPTILSSTEALGKLLRKESFIDSTSTFVDTFLFRIERIIPDTLSCISRAAAKRITITEILSINKARAVLGRYFMYAGINGISFIPDEILSPEGFHVRFAKDKPPCQI